MMTLEQTKLVGLTMQLDLKAKEFKFLCDKLEKIKQKGIDPNDKKLLEVKKMFEQNHNEIVEINKQIRKLKEEDASIVQEGLLNEKVKNEKVKKDAIKQEIAKIEQKETIFNKIINKIKYIIKKHS